MGLGPLEMHCHEVPAFEVFADRQPVEWGLTEVIEHSLVSQDGPDPIRPRRHRMAMDGLCDNRIAMDRCVCCSAE